MLIALLTLLFLGQGSGTTLFLDDLTHMEKSIRRTVQDETVRAEALGLVREIRDHYADYNRQRAETITLFLETEKPLARPAGDVSRQLDEFEKTTRRAQLELVRVFLELRSLLSREQWEAVAPPLPSE
jgi:hypothetical protein